MMSEKSQPSVLPTDSSYPAPTPKRSHPSWKMVALGALACTLYVSHPLSSLSDKWSAITRNHVVKDGPISWYRCDEPLHEQGYKCASAAAPLDYHNPSAGNASIAMIIYPTNATNARYLFTNPGGPGGSGFDFIARIGPQLNLLTGGQHHIVGFDPRGIGRTRPAFRCFTNQTQEDLYALRAAQHKFPRVHGNLSDPVVVAELERRIAHSDAQDAVIGGLCEDPENAGPYMSTAHVVRDIEYMSTLLAGPKKPIDYWGFSYGTTVGTYLTAMFPKRVGNVAIDAVMAVETWYGRLHFETSAEQYLVGFEDSWEYFVSECAKAGPDRCALAKSHKTTAAEISDAVDAFLESLWNRPLPVIKTALPGLLSRDTVIAHMQRAMYKPRNWGPLAIDLAAAMAGNGTAIYEAGVLSVQTNTSVKSDTRWAGQRVGCSDEPKIKVKKEDRVAVLVNQTIVDGQQYTRHFAGGFPEICWNWDSETTERFAGPLQPKLSNPMLIIGNTHDSICPLFNAKRIHEVVDDSILIHQDSAGHCSIAFTSLCTIKATQAYFANNTLFEDTLFCTADEELFPTEGATALQSGGEVEVYAKVMEDIIRAQEETSVRI